MSARIWTPFEEFLGHNRDAVFLHGSASISVLKMNKLKMLTLNRTIFYVVFIQLFLKEMFLFSQDYFLHYRNLITSNYCSKTFTISNEFIWSLNNKTWTDSLAKLIIILNDSVGRNNWTNICSVLCKLNYRLFAFNLKCITSTRESALRVLSKHCEKRIRTNANATCISPA